jgi:hypothetical protein
VLFPELVQRSDEENQITMDGQYLDFSEDSDLVSSIVMDFARSQGAPAFIDTNENGKGWKMLFSSPIVR